MLSVIFNARKFVKGFLRGFCWKSQGFLPPFDHPCHLKSGSNPPWVPRLFQKQAKRSTLQKTRFNSSKNNFVRKRFRLSTKGKLRLLL